MKKLFLKDGKLFVGEFPELPVKKESFESYIGTVYMGGDFGHTKRMEKYNAACYAAREKAVEVVNPDAIGFGLSAEYRTFFIDGDEHNEGELVDVPEGWTVEYQYQYKSLDKWYECTDIAYFQLLNSTNRKLEVRKIARLVPMAEKGAGDDYPVIEHSAHYETPEGIHGTHYGATQAGIVATGIPEQSVEAVLESGEKPLIAELIYRELMATSRFKPSEATDLAVAIIDIISPGREPGCAISSLEASHEPFGITDGPDKMVGK